MKKICLLLLLFIVQTINAQYTEVINAKFPGSSESPYSVGTKVLQVEGDLFYDNYAESNYQQTNSFGSNIYVRYGRFLENLEFDLNLTLQHSSVKFPTQYMDDYNVFGLRELVIGAKYLVYKKEYKNIRYEEIRSWKKLTRTDFSRLIPSIGIYAGLNTNFVANKFKEEGDALSPRIGILLQNTFNDKLNLITNIYGDKITSKNAEYFYVIAMTYAIDLKWSYFIENKGVFRKKGGRLLFSTGAAYLFNENLQFGGYVRSNFDTNRSNFTIGLGAAWRLDKHVEKKPTKEEEEKRKKKEEEQKKKDEAKKKKKEQRQAEKDKKKKEREREKSKRKGARKKEKRKNKKKKKKKK
ncbi:transporter [Aureivirga marina]|uniref:transporter n=1 Tax=Aureivirga marina TaxID=1182451 RepID=UPI0018CB3587|nr:transporter [Aureivirga marina]